MQEKVKIFLEELALIFPEQAKIVKSFREIALKACPQVEETMMYGGVVYKNPHLVCGIFSRKKHVTVEFDKGLLLEDPHNVLEGTGKNRRNIKLFLWQDIEEKHLEWYVKQIFERDK